MPLSLPHAPKRAPAHEPRAAAWRHLLCGLLLSLSLAQGPASAANLPTRQLLNALFSEPELQNEGLFPAQRPSDWPESDSLLEYLARQKAAGADLNAYRHLGTPLQHAIRAQQNELAQWLLKNGADPFLSIQGGQADALGVAVRVGNWEAAEWLLRHDLALLKKTAGANDPRAEQRAAQARASVNAAWNDAGPNRAQLDALLLRLRWRWSPEQEASRWRDRLQTAICDGQAQAALALLKAPVAAGWAFTADAQGAYCPARPSLPALPEPSGAAEAGPPGRQPASASPWPKAADWATWKAVDAQLPQPLLRMWLADIPHARALQAAVAQGLRAPWASAEGAEAYLSHAVHWPQPQGVALLRAMPSEVLRSTLNATSSIPPGAPASAAPSAAPERLVDWLAWAFRWPAADFRWMLAPLEPGRLAAAQAALLQRLYSHTSPNWAVLTERLVAPVAPVLDGFPAELPPALWPAWAQLGVRPTAAWWEGWAQRVALADLPARWPLARAQGASLSDLSWGRWLLRANEQELPAFWALLKVERPDLAPRALDWALAPLSYGPTPDPVAEALGVTGDAWASMPGGAWQRVRWLAAQGLKAQHPRWMAYELTGPAAGAEPATPALAEALAQGWAKKLPERESPKALRWAPPQLQCRLEADERLRKALAANQLLDNETENRVWESALPVQVPGLAACQWLFVGGDYAGRKFIDDEDFFTGNNRLTPCADGWRAAQFWHAASSRWQDAGHEPGNGSYFSLRAANSAEQVLGLTEGEQGGCGQTPGDVLQAVLQADGSVRLSPLPPAHPLRSALLAQCGTAMQLGECEALKAPPDAALKDRPGEPLGIAPMADRSWPQARTAFLAALRANDRPALQAQREAGLFAHWLDAGLLALAEPPALELAERRKRAAWVLAQSQPAPSYAPEVLASLVAWLPPEDWRPIVKRLGCSRVAELGELPAVRAKPALAQRLAKERDALDCAAD